jgi:AcrR family transcriptional regulator
LLREALVELIEERGFDRITVTEIAERAMVSRATFYRNHWSKYDVVEQIFDEAMDELLAGEGAPSLDRRATAFFERVADYERLYRALLGAQGSPWFASKMRSTIARRIEEHMGTSEHATTSRSRAGPGLVPTVIAATLVETIIWWLAQDPRPPAQEVAERTGRFALAIADVAG